MSIDLGAPSITAAWYADPLAPGRLRWWDGSNWTDHTSDPEPEVTPSLPSSESVLASAGWDHWTQGTGCASETAIPSAAIAPRWVQNQPIPLGSSETAALWFFAALPLLQSAVVWLALNIFASESTSLVRYALFVAPLVLYLWLAQIDRTALMDRGFAHAPSIGWAVLPPVYLLARTVRVSMTGLIALLVWCAVAAASVLLVLAQVVGTSVPVLLFGSGSADDRLSTNLILSRPTAGQVAAYTAPFSPSTQARLLTPAAMAGKIEFDYAVDGITGLHLECAPLASTAVASRTTCSGELAGDPLILEVEVVRSDGSAPPFEITLVSTLSANLV